MAEKQAPSQGRIVLFHDGRKDYTAIIARCSDSDDTVDLAVLIDDTRNPHTLVLGYVEFQHGVPRRDEPLENGDWPVRSWRWPTIKRADPAAAKADPAAGLI